MRSNVLLGLPADRLTPLIISQSSQVGTGIVRNATDDLHPFRPWRTSSTGSDQTLTLKGGASSETVEGFYVNNVNYSQIRLEGSAGGTVWHATGPNILRYTQPFNGTTVNSPSSPWGGGATGRLATEGETRGAHPSIPASRCTIGTSEVLSQAASTGTAIGGRSFVITAWLKSADGSNHDIRVRLAGNSNYDTTITITPAWTRFSVLASPGGGDSSTSPTVSLASLSGSVDTYCGGIMLTPDVTVSPTLDYLSEDLGLVVPYDTRVDRRHAYFEVTPTTYLRYTIPAQTPVDGATWFDTGGITLMQEMTSIWGGMTSPPQIGTNRDLETLVFPGGGREVLAHGAIRAIFRMSATMVERYHGSVIPELHRDAAKPFLLVWNFPRGEYAADCGVAQEAYLAWFVGVTNQSYSYNEIFEAELAFEEVI